MTLENLIYGKSPAGIGEMGLAVLLSAARPFYAAGLFIHRGLYDSGIKKAKNLPCRVVCIGNITLGGTGKTPTTRLAAKLLTDAHKHVVILSRGYGRIRKGRDLIVASDGRQVLSTPEEAGDEPFLLARALQGVPVIVCANRFRAGTYAIKHFHPDVILLDDGFQHWTLKRDCDCVCIDSTTPLGTLRLFPRGTLREPLTGLRRAQAVILTCTENTENTKEQEHLIREMVPDISILHLRYRAGAVVPLSDRESFRIPPHKLAQKSVLLLCGIANPDSFFALARGVAPKIVKQLSFPDHVHYTPEHIREIQRAFTYSNADIAITTEKDAVKLAGAGLTRSPLYYVELETKFENEEETRHFLSILSEAEK